MSLLPINPADFPDVPTRKALIALDLQNDFLASDGALPVKQPDGMVDKILKLADAFRGTGYGEIIWVRSQFDTSRPAGEQDMMAADTPQLPTRPSASAAARAARSPKSPASLEADPEAFLSMPGDDQAQKTPPSTKPKCVRKGTKGVELLPTIAAAKGPRDYAMTKSYYSAFQSGQLLNLLRRQFATELYICGSMSNVSVYATALAASSHGFEITIVEDCCGFRSEMRHMNAARRLMEQTGCEFRNAADVIPTLKPKPSSSGASRAERPPGSPAQIPAGLIAAAMAGSKGLPVRPRPAAPPPDTARSTEKHAEKRKSDAKRASPAQLSPSTTPPDLVSALDGLKLSADSSDNADVPGRAITAPATDVATTALGPKSGPAQPEAGEEVQPVVIKPSGAERTAAQELGTGSAPPDPTKESSEPAAVPEPQSSKSAPKGQKGPGIAAASTRSGEGVKEADEPVSPVVAHHVSAQKRASTSSVTGVQPQLVGSEKLSMTSAADSASTKLQDTSAETKDPASPKQARGESDDQQLLEPPERRSPTPKLKTHDEPPVGEDPVRVEESGIATTTMAGDSKTRSVVSKPMCEGDTTLTEDFLPPCLIDGLFEKLCAEVHFEKMLHQGGVVPRFVAVQGAVEEDGTQPVYRHPSDESPPLKPFTPIVQKIREHTEKALGHPVNHVLIQGYRDGNDYISEHSDKTLDIFRWSYIANVSIGAQRTMVFRTKRAEKKTDRRPLSTTPDELPMVESEDLMLLRLETSEKGAAPKQAAVAPPPKRQTVRCAMPHNSLLKMGLVTNEKWVHGIKPDKRPRSEKTPAEIAWNGIRISLTFRNIATFLSPPLPKSPVSPVSPTSPNSPNSYNDVALTADADDEPVIWGQGATSKSRAGAQQVINGQTTEAISLIRAFGRENNSPDFDWEANYGPGYDVLHMKAAPRYFGCGDALVDGRVRLMLAECGVKYARGDIGRERPTSGLPLVRGAPVGEVIPVRFEMDDAERTTVVGDVAILLYLHVKYPRKRTGGDAELARTYGRLYAAIALEQRWKRSWESAAFERPFQKRRVVVKQFKPSLLEFEAYVLETKIGGGPSSASISGGAEVDIADCALWPVLHDIAEAWKSVADESAGGRTVFGYLGLPALDEYYATFARRRSAVLVFGGGAVDATVPFKPDLPTEEFGLRPVEPLRSPGSREKHLPQQDGVRKDECHENRKDVTVDGERDGTKPSSPTDKGKLPMLTEFGGWDT